MLFSWLHSKTVANPFAKT